MKTKQHRNEPNTMYVPRMCEWELTLECNFGCLHCSALAGVARRNELDTVEALDLAGQLSELGCEMVALTGGEPLLRPDWPVIARALVERGIRVSILTNGWTLDPGTAREMNDAGVMQVVLSLDGLRETHDRIRRKPGAFDRIIAAIENLEGTSVQTSITTTLNRWNLDEIGVLDDLLCRVGVASWHVLLASHNGRDIDGFWLRPHDVLDVVPTLARLRSTSPIRIMIGDNIGYYGRYENEIRRAPNVMQCWSGCYAGRYIMGIESDGGIKGCLSMPSARHGCSSWVEGNVRETPLHEIWCRSDAFLYNRVFRPDDLKGLCRTCKYASLCRGGCRWTARHHADGTMENEYCYHRQFLIGTQRRSGTPYLRQMTSAAALSLGLILGGCYESAGIVRDPPTDVDVGQQPEALFLPSWESCDPDGHTRWQSTVPSSPVSTDGLTLPLGPFEDLDVEGYALLHEILCPLEVGGDWSRYHPCCMSRMELFHCLQSFCTSGPSCDDEAIGSLSVTTEPLANVFVDEEEIGTTPIAGFDLEPGIHLVTLVNEDAGIWKSYYAMIVNCGVTEIDRNREQLTE